MRLIGAAIAAILLNSCAHISSSERSASLVLAEWRGVQATREDPRCRSGDLVCIDVVADVRFSSVRSLSGPVVPGSLVALTVFHSDPPVGSTVLLAIQTSPGGSRRAKILDIVRDHEDVACFGERFVKDLHIAVPTFAFRRGDYYCFTIV